MDIYAYPKYIQDSRKLFTLATMKVKLKYVYLNVLDLSITPDNRYFVSENTIAPACVIMVDKASLCEMLSRIS